VSFSMAYSSHLFTPFQSLHQVGEFEGIGVGLSIADRIVRRHGGRIWAESLEGKGATFYFTLQAESPEVTAKPERVARTDLSSPKPTTEEKDETNKRSSKVRMADGSREIITV